MINNAVVQAIPLQNSSGSQMFKDPQTGLLEFRGHPNLMIVRNGKIEPANRGVGPAMGFTVAKKLVFLKCYLKCWPNMTIAAKKAGITRQTAVDHMRVDSVFAMKVQEIIDAHVDGVESSMLKFSKRPKNYMDRITIARGYRPETWDPAKRVIVQHQGGRMDANSARNRLGGLNDIIDGEVVSSQFDPDRSMVSTQDESSINQPIPDSQTGGQAPIDGSNVS